MREIIISLAVILLLCLEFQIYGIVINHLFRSKVHVYENGLIGFFAYFGLFQIVALPLILLQQSFSVLYICWIIICILVNGYALIWRRKEIKHTVTSLARGIWQMKCVLLLLTAAIIVITCYLHAIRIYVAWDTSYYVGTVNTTVYTDQMFIFNGNTGIKEKVLDLRYALSAFYMHSAILSRMFSLSAIMVLRLIMGSVCILTYGQVLFAFGKRLFKADKRIVLGFVLIGFILNYGFYTEYSTAQFLLIRGYEGKGFCANVVIPAISYCFLCLWQEREKWDYRMMLFIMAFASVPISMSSLLTIPVMLAIFALTEAIVTKRWKMLWWSIICAVPNGIYLIVYFLYTQGYTIAIK